jgi:hypothetical protein
MMDIFGKRLRDKIEVAYSMSSFSDVSGTGEGQ